MFVSVTEYSHKSFLIFWSLDPNKLVSYKKSVYGDVFQKKYLFCTNKRIFQKHVACRQVSYKKVSFVAGLPLYFISTFPAF